MINPCLQLAKITFANKTTIVRQLRNTLYKSIKDTKEKIDSIRELFVKSKLEIQDYQELREACEQSLAQAELQLAALPPPPIELEDITQHQLLSYFALQTFITRATVDQKRKLIGLLINDGIEIIAGSKLSINIKEHFKIIFKKK